MHHDQKIRYARNISLPQLGEEGQKKLLSSKVLVIGAGGLGSPLLLYLAAAGVGNIGIIDKDKVALSNLQRQIIHESEDVGRSKVFSARDTISYLNPDVQVDCYECDINEQNADSIVSKYDMVADCTDNFETRFLVNDVCIRLKKTLVSAAMIGFKGQIYVFKSHEDKNLPCYRCLVPELPPADATPICSESGILGAIGGVMGSLQAMEIIKDITGAGDSLAGNMILFDGLTSQFRKVKINKDKNCKSCRN